MKCRCGADAVCLLLDEVDVMMGRTELTEPVCADHKKRGVTTDGGTR